MRIYEGWFYFNAISTVHVIEFRTGLRSTYWGNWPHKPDQGKGREGGLSFDEAMREANRGKLISRRGLPIPLRVAYPPPGEASRCTPQSWPMARTSHLGHGANSPGGGEHQVQISACGKVRGGPFCTEGVTYPPRKVASFPVYPPSRSDGRLASAFSPPSSQHEEVDGPTPPLQG